MKSKLGILLKNNIINSFKLKALTKRKLILFIFLAIYLIGTCVFSLSMFLNTIFKSLVSANMTSYFIPLIFTISSLFALIFTVFSAKAWLFDNKDNDLLLSLPIKRSTILLNRFLYLCLLNLILGLIIIGPGLYIYISNVGISAIFCLSAIFMTIFFPVIPTIIASIFGYLIAYITSKAKNKNMIELLSYTIFIVVYMYLFSNANTLVLNLIKDPVLMDTILKTVFLPIYLISRAIILDKFIYIIYFILLNLAVITLFVILLNKSYFAIITKLNAHQTKTNFKMATLNIKSKINALRSKEVKRYFSSAIYVFNTLFGIVLMIIVAGASFFYSPDKILSLVGEGMKLDSFKLVFCLSLFAVALTDTTNSSISIERGNFWIMKMLPVTEKDIFNAKVFVNQIIVIPIAILSLVIFNISGYLSQIEMLLLMIFTIFFNSFVANFGLIVNLLFPRFDAINDTVVVKQSTSSFIGIIGPLFIAIPMILLALKSNLSNQLLVLMAIAICAILYVVTVVIINNWGVKRFREIN